MSTTHADILKGRWYRSKYYADGGFIKPVPGGKVEYYNPFDFYRPGNRVWDNLHYIFASLDLSDEASIVGFYSRFGPLGFFERDIIKIVAFPPHLNQLYPMPKESLVAGVQRDSDELMPMDELMAKYHISPGKLPIPKEDAVVLPTTEITALDTWEHIEVFRNECKNFKWLLEIINAVGNKDTELLRELFKNYKEAQGYNDTELLLAATGTIMWMVNGELSNKAYPHLTYDDSGIGISKNITWWCDSLLTAIYMMVFIDITRGALTKKCEYELCGRYFESSNPDKFKYCSVSCQTRAKTKRYRDKQIKESKEGLK